MMRSSVVLPLPDAPSTAVIDLSGTVRSTSVSTCTGPKATAQALDPSAIVPLMWRSPPAAGLRRRANQAATTRFGTAASSTMATA